MRREPLGLERVAGASQIVEHVAEVLRHEVRQHEAIVQRRAPAHRRRGGTACRQNDATSAAQQELLRQAHARVRRHLERAQLEQPLPPAGAVGAEELVDAQLGAVGVAGDVDQQVAEDAIDQPRRRRRPPALASICRNAISSSSMLSWRASSTRGAWLVGPTNMPENRYDSDG